MSNFILNRPNITNNTNRIAKHKVISEHFYNAAVYAQLR